MNIISNGLVLLEKQKYSNADAENKMALATAGIGAVAGIGSALASRPKTLSEVEQKCGKKPLIRGKARNQWNDCAKEFGKSSQTPITTSKSDVNTERSKKIPTWAWVVGGVVVATLIGFVIYKSVKK